ncbi:class v [Fusarium sporotrichioides]|uniref:Class v n=1 Tax=Fusarium sporotrichioides TaxID=5514 RepID=A0A395RUM6_FUSSP|nr:class v [Fusarium sporotrichioides]
MAIIYFNDKLLPKRHDNRTQSMINFQGRSHARDLASGQSSLGGFLDPNIYRWLECGYDDDGDENTNADGDPCTDDSNPCGDDDVELPDDADPTLDALPVSGVSTRPVTLEPHHSTTTAPSCAYTSPLPKTTLSISRLPTAPTGTASSAPSPSPYVLIIYTREMEVAGHGDVIDTWWWDCRPFNKVDPPDSDVCNLKDYPMAYSTAIGRVSPAKYPTSLATFSLHGHASCSYHGPNTATVGSVMCDDGLTAKCTATPEASQTSYVDCIDRDESQNGAVKNFCYRRVSCEYK